MRTSVRLAHLFKQPICPQEIGAKIFGTDTLGQDRLEGQPNYTAGKRRQRLVHWSVWLVARVSAESAPRARARYTETAAMCAGGPYGHSPESWTVLLSSASVTPGPDVC